MVVCLILECFPLCGVLTTCRTAEFIFYNVSIASNLKGVLQYVEWNLNNGGTCPIIYHIGSNIREKVLQSQYQRGVGGIAPSIIIIIISHLRYVIWVLHSKGTLYILISDGKIAPR